MFLFYFLYVAYPQFLSHGEGVGFFINNSLIYILIFCRREERGGECGGDQTGAAFSAPVRSPVVMRVWR